MMFLENPENLPQVNHKDCNKANNHVSNLEWTRRPDNIDHAHRNGRMQKRYDVGPITPLTADEVRDVYLSVMTGKEGVAEAGRRIGRSRTTISSIINKRSRRDITDELDKELDTPTQNTVKFNLSNLIRKENIMGYYTDFELTTRNSWSDEQEEQIIYRLQDLSGYPLKWGSQNNEMKWYTHEQDMLTVSKEFPDVHFILEGKGEEHEDIWIKHFKNGKKVTLKGEIKFPEFKGFEGE